ncbi:hypothetical protein CAPTEDRAFT_190623 [Capitella teleta]|uniref:Uncharacterized protein n=1 Tax=Capitella teleta TaxID=283909 RepID=R7U370_CAPTE|nr:hypothetical protein CAPTEDRAFT_190623 [Capitella teleta]|eukprot:ELU00790.1 hypothetical protein CAPTEDRAFT_190623 [Capitella teleta]
MGRQIRNTLPTLPENLKPAWPADDIVRRRDEERKTKSSDYYDKRHGVVPLLELKSGQRVFVPDRKELGVVIGANETPRSIMVQVGNRVIRRNRHDLRVLPTALNLPVSEEDSSGSPVPATFLQSSVPCAVFSRTSEGVPGDVSPRALRHVPPRSAPVVSQPVASSPSVQANQKPDPVTSTPTASSGVHTKCGRLVRPPSKLNL